MGRQERKRPVREGRPWVTNEDLGVASTGSTAVSIPNYGLSHISSAANTWVLDAPEPGVVKTLFSAAGSSAARVIKLHPVSSGDSITVGPTATEIAIHSTAETLVQLIGVSSVKWHVLAASTGGGAAAVNSTGVVFQAS